MNGMEMEGEKRRVVME